MRLRKPLSILLLTITILGSLIMANAANVTSNQEADSISAQTEQPVTKQKAKKKTDWMQIIFGGSYLIGIFILFPLVVHTNLKEKLFDPITGNKENIKMRSGLTIEERNQISAEILEEIESRLTPFKDENGNDMITITKGKQARYMKRGLDYINTRLCPTDQDVLKRIDEFAYVYNDRTKREFTGSKWILGCAIGLLVLMGIIDISILLSAFTVIQIIGIVFYYLSSRTPRYILDKRMASIGSKGPGIVCTIMTSLLAGMAVKQYVSINGGPWQRDHESELSSSAITLFLIFIAAIFVAFMIALFGILNFFLNYSTSFLNPVKTLDKWYEKNYTQMQLAA